MATLILHASQMLTMAGSDGPRAGREKGSLGVLNDGAVLIAEGKIVAAGPSARVLAHPQAHGAARISAKGGVLAPGFVDAHTHPVFAAPRLDDFEGRIQGATGIARLDRLQDFGDRGLRLQPEERPFVDRLARLELNTQASHGVKQLGQVLDRRRSYWLHGY